MRAIFCEIDSGVTIGTEITIDGDRAHHLMVVRIKINEELLILNGKGNSFTATVIDISKKEISVKIINKNSLENYHNINLAIATPKKDAFEDILRMAVELGVRKIYPLSSEFSQYEYTHSERINKLLESALIQSNNGYMPIIATQVELKDFLLTETQSIYYFSAPQIDVPSMQFVKNKSGTLLIGPEAGFSNAEEELLRSQSKLISIHLPTPIMRAPTAVAAALGYLLST